MSNNIGLPMTWKDFIDEGRRLNLFLIDSSETGKLPTFVEANIGGTQNIYVWKTFLGLPLIFTLLQVRNHITAVVGGEQVDTKENIFKFKFHSNSLFKNSGS